MQLLCSDGPSNVNFTNVYESSVFPVKIFSGDAETDESEFHEVRCKHMTIADFLSHDSTHHMIKVDIKLSRHPLLGLLFNIVQSKARELLSVPDTLCNMSVLRITGPKWRFPMHFDAGNQIVLHLQGVKMWFWRDATGEWHSYQANPGDIIYIPAGVWHATQNVSTSVMLNYGWVCNATRKLTRSFVKAYPHRAKVILNNGDAFSDMRLEVPHARPTRSEDC